MNRMDKRKMKTVEKVKKNLELTIQDRRRILDLLLDIGHQEKSMQLQKEHINDFQSQIDSGIIEAKDKWGNPQTKSMLGRTKQVFELDLEKMAVQLKYMKEDLFFKLNGQKLEKVRDQLNGHYALMEEEYEKTKKVLANV